MRCATGLFTLLIATGLVGCRSQSAPLANPFLTADRVPPPSTQVLPPGAAQPYYQGELAPGAATSAPPAASFPPAGTYTAPPGSVPPVAFPNNPITPTSPPPAGWPSYQPQASSSVPAAQLFNSTTGDAVQVPSDSQRVRFDPPSLSAAPISTAATVGPRIPAGTYPSLVQQATFSQPAAGTQSGLQRLQAREVTPAEFATTATPAGAPTPSAPIAALATGDGFRPQSAASLTSGSDAVAVAKGFRPPALGNGSPTDAAKTSTERFAVGPAQAWLRGQLEYWPETGEWSIRYMPDGQVDQIGGRILVDNPLVLGNLSPGEFVMVEGQVFGRQIDEDYYRPVYRVTVVQRQRQ